MLVYKVIISRRAEKDLSKVPSYIVDKLDLWVDAIERFGMGAVRKIHGYHDEPLHGLRKGQRSIRLSKSYRAIYILREQEIIFVNIIEVTKHDY